MDGLTLALLFLVVSIPMLKYNTVSLFTIFYGTTVIYFIPVFLGYYIHANFLSQTPVMDVRETSDYAKFIFLFIITNLSIFHWLSIKFNLVKPVHIQNTPKLVKIMNISAILMLLTMIATIIKLGGVIFSDEKQEIMRNLGSFYNAKVIFQLFLLASLLLTTKKARVLWLLLTVGIMFDLFIGFRYTLVYSAIIYFIIRFYGHKISGSKMFYGGFAFIILFIFFASFGNIRTELRLFDFEAIIGKFSSIAWWAYNFTHFEPMHIFAILNETIETGFSCSALDILGSSFVVSFLPLSGFFIELQTFNDCFVPIIFSGFENISSNPWAEFYSFYGLMGIVLLIWFLGGFLLISQKLLQNKNLFVFLFTISVLGIVIGYFQRSDFVIFFFAIKRVFMALLLVYLFSKIKYRWKKID